MQKEEIIERIITKSQEIGALIKEPVFLDIGESPPDVLKRLREEREELKKQLLA